MVNCMLNWLQAINYLIFDRQKHKYMLLKVCFGLLTAFCFFCNGYAQEITYSAPQKVTSGYARVDVLGKNTQGIIVRHIGRSSDEILAYYDNLQLRWKKTTPKKEKNGKLEQVVLYNDSVIFFYSIIVKNITLLKAFKTNARLESSTLPVIVDTINRTLINTSPELRFSFTPDKSKILLYYEDAAFNSTKALFVRCYNNNLKSIWSSTWKAKSMDAPVLIEAVLDIDGNAAVVLGENYVKNFNNDFTCSALYAFRIKEKGKKFSEYQLLEKDHLLTPCKAQIDLNTGNLLMAGLYAKSAGVESDGAYFFVVQDKDSGIIKKFEPHSVEFITQLTGNNPPKKNDGFYEFQPKELIVTRDGGGILITEAISVSSESYAGSNYGTFGISSGFTVNYYHYDEMAVFSFNGSGILKWKQILHKKQGTEGDGGYYSSFATIISPDALHFIYNDVQNGQTTVGGYNIDVTGKQEHIDVFNADRKGVLLIPMSARQVSPNEVVVPSLKRSYLQFVKIMF